MLEVNIYKKNTDEETQVESTEEYFQNDRSLMGFPNNIVAFCSARGNGKTSAMLTMISALLRIHDKEKQNVIERFWNRAHTMTRALPNDNRLNNFEVEKKESSPVLKKNFFSLGTIDPTTMEKHDSVLEILIARMLQMILKKYKNSIESVHNKRPDMEQYKKLLRLFSEAQKKIRALKQKKVGNDFDEFERIRETDDSRSAKYAFFELTQETRKYLKCDMMIFPVDDTDMDPAKAFEVMEDLRKYCDIPGVIVIMSLHLGTLKNTIEQQYIGNYRFLLQNGYEIEHMSKYACRELAERYIDKLIPDMHQIWLPYFNQRIQDGRVINLYYFSKDINGKKIDLLPLVRDHDSNEEIRTYLDRLTMLIYKKTGVVFLEKKGYLHDFLPKRYRDLTHMLSFFTRLADIEIDGAFPLDELIAYRYFGIRREGVDQNKYEDILECRMRNMEQLENYFFSLWCPLNLTKAMAEHILELRSAGMTAKNRCVISILQKYCIENGVEKIPETLYYQANDIVSFADVLMALKLVKRLVVDNRHKFEYLHAIQIYYTIYMNKIMCKCLKEGSGFQDLKTLTGGMITRQRNDVVCYSFSKKVNCSENDNSSVRYETGFAKQNSKQYILFGCNDHGHLKKENSIAGEVVNKEGLNYRIEPCGFLFYWIDAFDTYCLSCKKTPDDSLEPKKLSSRENKKKMWSDLMAITLQYICNYDLQYHAKLDFINSEGEIDGIRTRKKIIQAMRGEIEQGRMVDQGRKTHYFSLVDDKMPDEWVKINEEEKIINQFTKVHSVCPQSRDTDKKYGGSDIEKAIRIIAEYLEKANQKNS